MKNLFDTCKRAELCKIECPQCNNEMCNGLKDNGKECCCYDPK